MLYTVEDHARSHGVHGRHRGTLTGLAAAWWKSAARSEARASRGPANRMAGRLAKPDPRMRHLRDHRPHTRSPSQALSERPMTDRRITRT